MELNAAADDAMSARMVNRYMYIICATAEKNRLVVAGWMAALASAADRRKIARLPSAAQAAAEINSMDPIKIAAVRAALTDLLERDFVDGAPASTDAGDHDAMSWRAFVTDACVRRYLRARGGNVKKASAMLRKTLLWRAKARPQDARPVPCTQFCSKSRWP